MRSATNRAAGRHFGGVALATLAALVACTSPGVRQQEADFRAFCDQHAGVWIYRTVTPVDGFYAAGDRGCGASCRTGLLRDGFAFVEAEATDAGAQTAAERALAYVPGPGLYRFSVAPGGAPRCYGTPAANRADTREYRTYVVPEHRLPEGTRRDVCIAAKRIEAVTAEYEIRRGGSGTRSEARPTASRYEYLIANRATGEVLARSVDFRDDIDPGGWLTERYGVGCIAGADALRYRDVLVPSPKPK